MILFLLIMDTNTPAPEILDTVRQDVTQENPHAAILHLTLLVEQLNDRLSRFEKSKVESLDFLL